MFTKNPLPLPTQENALPGRPDSIPTADKHFVFDRKLCANAPSDHELAVFGLGCFWGAERIFWQTPGIWLTRVGYAGGMTPNPTYEEVCSGQTGHTEVVEVIYDPHTIEFSTLVKLFLESHDPTQGMQQGNDVGTQYRSALYYTTEAQRQTIDVMVKDYQSALIESGRSSAITTEIGPRSDLYLAEDYHQQYLAKNPTGYCGIGGTGVSCPMPPLPE